MIQSATKNTTTEMKTTFEEINSRAGEARNQKNNLEDKKAENTQSEQQKEINLKENEYS